MKPSTYSLPPAGLRQIGRTKTLLTESESQCFSIARDYQRKHLIRSLVPEEFKHWTAGFKNLGWSKNPLVLAIQASILLLAIPPISVWLVFKCTLRLLAFPVRYVKTYITPKDLAAPGEKTLVGMHNAFSRHLCLGAVDSIACLNDWVKILYGERACQQYQTKVWLNPEISKLEHPVGNDLSPALRSVVAVSREKLSKQLGHYVQIRNAPLNAAGMGSGDIRQLH